MKQSLGFTLIELLVVLGILGILAAGLLAAIDPFEQLKKGRDTNLRNTVIELLNGFTRYYATHGGLPWCPAGTCTTFTTTKLSDTTFWDETTGYLQDLIDDGELKTEFRTGLGVTNGGRIYVTSGDPTEVIICFQPDSKALRNDDTVQYDADGSVNATKACDTSGTTNGCYWCAR